MIGPEEVIIETPEQIELGLEPVGPGTRFLAWMVDILIKGVILAVLYLAAYILGAATGNLPAFKELSGYPVAIVLALTTLVVMAYDVYFEVRNNGQTPGKRVAGVRVIRDGGGPVDFTSACIRWVLSLIDCQPGLTYFLGGTVILMTPRRQRLGDLAAGTLVIRERAESAYAEIGSEVKKLADEAITFTTEQLTNCTPSDRHILRAYFQRYRTMEGRARRDLAGRLAALLVARLKYTEKPPAITGKEAVNFLASLYRDLENWYQNR